MSRGTSAIRDTGEEARWKSGKRRKEGIIHERAMGERERERKKRVRARRVSRSRDPRCDGVIGYELTGAKGPSRVPRCGADLEGVNWSRGRNRFITKREERRRRDFARTARTTLRIRRDLLLPAAFFARAHTHFMLLALIPRPPSAPLSQQFFFYFALRSTWTMREVETPLYLPSYLRQTVPNHAATLCLSFVLSPFLHLSAACLLHRNLARLRSVVLREYVHDNRDAQSMMM